MKVFAEASEALRERCGHGVDGQVLIYETAPTAHNEDEEWVQLTYDSLRDETGGMVAQYKHDADLWEIIAGEHTGKVASDLIVTP